MQKTTYNFDEIMEQLDELQTDIDISYEIKDIRPDVCAEYKELIRKGIDDILRLDWNINTEETIKVTDKIISLKGQLNVY